MMGRVLSAVIALGVTVYAGPSHVPEGIIDLGYAVHQGVYNVTGNFFTYQNIRFAEPPVGLRRFKPPVAVTTVDRTINSGADGFVCTQGYPRWYLKKLAAKLDVPVIELRNVFNSFAGQGEDCLFLDVYSPRSVDAERRAPVVVRIPDVNFVHGQKNFPPHFHAAGMMARSQEKGGDGIVFVSISYRLGMYGWLNAGDDRDVSPNVGLQDQLMALQWVKRYIHLFGGDPDNITVMGHTAGGASIMHHITAKGGRSKVPFSRAIVQSPSFETVVDAPAIWKRTLELAGKFAEHKVLNGAELAALDESILFQVNDMIIDESPPGSFTFGPTVDGDYVPDLPGILLRDGKFDPSPSLIIGHNSNEWLEYFEVNRTDEKSIRKSAQNALQGISEEKSDTIWSLLYPLPSKTTPYKTESERSELLISEFSYICNTKYLSTAFGDKTWNYRFQLSPGFHGQDIAYTFYNGPNNATGFETDEKLAENMQRYFTNFAQFGNPNDPNAGGLPQWPENGGKARLVTFGSEGVDTEAYETMNKRCEVWQTGNHR